MYPVILYDNRFLDAVPEASATAAGYDVRHISDRRPYTFWKGDGPGTFYLSVNCGAQKDADAVGILSHNLGTAWATVSVESSGNGSIWTERLAGFVPGDDKALLKTFALASDLHWRLKIVSPTIAPQIAVCQIGEKLIFPFPPDTPYPPYIEDVEEESSISKTGHPLGTVIRYKPIRVQARFSNVDRAWAFDDFQKFWDDYASDRKFFFYAWDLDAFPEHVFFLKHRGNWQTPLSLASVADSITLDMEGARG